MGVSLVDSLSMEEPLSAELQEWTVVEGKSRFLNIKHPLVYSILHVPQMNYFMNRQLEQKKEQIKKAMLEKNWAHIVALHERPWRLQSFLEVSGNMTDSEYWETLHWIWTDSENIWQHIKDWRKVLMADRTGNFMNEEDQAELAKLPESLTVYRGYQKGKNYDGLSYTMDKEKAEWFSHRFCKSDRGAVRMRSICKSQVFAYVASRNEQEIIILPPQRES